MAFGFGNLPSLQARFMQAMQSPNSLALADQAAQQAGQGGGTPAPAAQGQPGAAGYQYDPSAMTLGPLSSGGSAPLDQTNLGSLGGSAAGAGAGAAGGGSDFASFLASLFGG